MRDFLFRWLAGLFLLAVLCCACVAEQAAGSDDAYCVIDVVGGPMSAYYPVSFRGNPPAGGWSDDYKLSKIVLKKVVPVADGTNAVASAPFYMGLFELTQSQYRLVTGRVSKSYRGETRPVADLLWSDLRGNSRIYDWPATNTVDEASFLGILRRKTGLNFDLPSVAQWCCAAEVELQEGRFILRGTDADILNCVQCYETRGAARGGYSTATTVGSFAPNGQGFFDMLGNVSEWCLDHRGAARFHEEESGRVACGGMWRHRLGDLRSLALVNYRPDRPDEFGENRFGARICLAEQGRVRPSFGEHPYCVIDLTRGMTPNSSALSFLDDVPEGGWGRAFKTDKLLLRRIEPGKFKFQGRFDVEITRPFYIGVFEVTARQFEHVTGVRFDADRPIDAVAVTGPSWWLVRCDPDAGGKAADAYDWPVSRKVFKDSFVGRLSCLTGRSFDLPTEAQWEYACKAGTSTKYSLGEEVENKRDLFPFVHYDCTPVWHYGGNDLYVGRLLPNRWGLYDMLGNVAEMCLDNASDPVEGVAPRDPLGPLYDVKYDGCRVLRGGSVRNGAEKCTAESRSFFPYFADEWDVGFRVVMECPDS